MKKFVAFLLAMVLCLSTASALAWNLEGTMFPLEEKTKFTILTSGYRYATLSAIQECEDWQNLLAETNVEIEFVFLGDYDAEEARNNLQMRLLGEDYGDAIMSVYVNNLSAADIQELGTAGMLVPVQDYLNNPEVMPNFYKNVAQSHDYILNNMKSADGNTYAFYGVDELAGYTSGEALMQVNVAWLDAWKAARGVENDPATLAEFEDMLAYFRDNDLNGNGEKDEIPYFVAQAGYSGCATVEHVMGLYGVSTKDSAADMNIMIDNDQVYFVHTTEKYKAALKTLASWYKDSLIWDELFTANAETINDKMATAKNTMGVVNVNLEIDGFRTLMPPSVEGYTARYHMHPARRSGIGQPYAVITNKCEKPEVLAAFLDLMYDFENYLTWRYSSNAFENGQLVLNEEGKYVFDVPAEPVKGDAVANADRAIFDFMWGLSVNTQDVFNSMVDMDSYFGDQTRIDGHIAYAENGIWNPTESIWPRCTIPDEYAEDYSFMYTDVSAVLAEYRAKFITGQYDVDEKWDEFQNKMKALGIEEMTEIVQKAYDAYLK